MSFQSESEEFDQMMNRINTTVAKAEEDYEAKMVALEAEAERQEAVIIEATQEATSTLIREATSLEQLHRYLGLANGVDVVSATERMDEMIESKGVDSAPFVDRLESLFLALLAKEMKDGPLGQCASVILGLKLGSREGENIGQRLQGVNDALSVVREQAELANEGGGEPEVSGEEMAAAPPSG